MNIDLLMKLFFVNAHHESPRIERCFMLNYLDIVQHVRLMLIGVSPCLKSFQSANIVVLGYS